MGEPDDPKEELEFYFKLANPLALSLPDADEKARAAAWLRRLGEEEAGPLRMRADYLRLLVFALQRRRLVGVFAAPPDASQPLQPFQDGASVRGSCRHVQTLPPDRPRPGLCAQPAPKERSRRRSAPGQLQPCPCSPDSPPPRSPLASSTPCDCRPPAPPPVRVACPAASVSAPAANPCECPPSPAPAQPCRCSPPIITPCPGAYESSSYELDDEDTDQMVFSWMDKPAVSAAAQDAALRALSDACDDSSVRFAPLWKSEESGFEPMEWDSYHRAHFRPNRAAEYRGGPVYTTASRMAVRRSAERLADGSVVATEERTTAGAAARVSPPPAGSCPAVTPPRSTGAAVGTATRRVTWTPPPATSTPCECAPASRRLALPYSPPSPVGAGSPCRRIRYDARKERAGSEATCAPPAHRTRSPTSSMTPDSLETSRALRSASLRSPRRSLSAESIVPCPASGRQLDSVSPPSALRFSGSAGLSRSPRAGRTLSPCPASQRRTPSPLAVCPAARGIDSMSPPSALRFSGSGGLSREVPCPSYSQRSPSPPPCSPDPYANIRRPKRFFSPLRGEPLLMRLPLCSPMPAHADPAAVCAIPMRACTLCTIPMRTSALFASA
ncbi:serine/arginine repetitive matrix protein 1-like [Schistocerca piceifrons]|uniref:serine/arginine repetitive matrix protein 1-like n=1 Tax=Schistocerca piceifrons TaxID=274613 RepID=UPI001F5F9139|nr:serine/arginine repetitive matrix protein 1-like [Schistocerca piceifrons]